jgi:hypothetical protein
MSTYEWIDQENMVYRDNGIIFSHQKKKDEFLSFVEHGYKRETEKLVNGIMLHLGGIHFYN